MLSFSVIWVRTNSLVTWSRIRMATMIVPMPPRVMTPAGAGTMSEAGVATGAVWDSVVIRGPVRRPG